MQLKNITPAGILQSFVKNILVFENDVTDTKNCLPFFADGYPGVIFQTAINGIYLKPGNKKLTPFFLYGQTIRPVEFTVEGRFVLIVFQLYPYVTKFLFGVEPKALNDNCLDLNTLPCLNTNSTVTLLNKASSTNTSIEIISSFLVDLIKAQSNTSDDRISLAIHCMIAGKGNLSVKALRNQLHITERTFERQFVAQTGITPKQFLKIIQFQHSLNQLNNAGYSRLTDVVFDNGFADQSHFTKTFKKYSGKTPAAFQKMK